MWTDCWTCEDGPSPPTKHYHLSAPADTKEEDAASDSPNSSRIRSAQEYRWSSRQFQEEHASASVGSGSESTSNVVLHGGSYHYDAFFVRINRSVEAQRTTHNGRCGVASSYSSSKVILVTETIKTCTTHTSRLLSAASVINHWNLSDSRNGRPRREGGDQICTVIH